LGQRGMTMWGCLTSVVRNEGPFGLYKGLIPQLVGQVPEKAIRLFIVDRIRSMSATDTVNYPIELLAGLAAGANQVLITNPAEIVKVRLQVQGQDLKSHKTEAGTGSRPYLIILS
jgi:solute carrier family 25 aspartate/glutamate transporter 12/13